MAREQWYADQWEITQGLVRDVEKRDGLYRSAAKRGSNITVASQDGDVWRPKRSGPGSFVLNLWLGGDSRTLVEQYWDDLIRAVTPDDRLVRYTRQASGGEWRECYGEVVSAVEPAHFGQVLVRAAVEVNVPNGRWQGLTDVSDSGGVGGLALNAFTGSTAPMDSLVYRITGPITSPTVHDSSNGIYGHSFTWTGVVGAGQTLTVDSGTWQVTGGGGLVVPHVGPLIYTGDRILRLPVSRPGNVPRVELSGLNIGGGAGLTVTGRRAYAA